MGLFQQLEGEAAVLSVGGVFKEADLYQRNGLLFAKLGNGFVQLMEDGSTSSSKARLDTLSFEGPLYRTPLGKLAIHPEVPCIANVKPLDTPRQQKLLGLAS